MTFEYILTALFIGIMTLIFCLCKWHRRKKTKFTLEERKLVAFYNMNMFSAFVEHFHKFKINPNITDYNGTTLLMTVMAKDTSYPFIEFLLKQGADPNKQDCSGRTALMMACYWNEKKLVPLLLDYKANPNISTFIRGGILIDVNPVMACFYKEHYDIARILLQRGASPQVVEETAQKTKKMLKPIELDMLWFYKRRVFRENILFARICQKEYLRRKGEEGMQGAKGVLLGRIPEVYFAQTVKELF